jgi:hypothetical protein
VSDEVIRYTWQVPDTVEGPHLGARMEEQARRVFAEALFDWVSTRAGAIIGPIHFREQRQTDFFSPGLQFTQHTMYCHVTELPSPPTYALIGGPAHNRIIRTNGENIWRVPMAPPMPSVANIADPAERFAPRYAEYRLIPGTQAYEFSGIREG